MTQKYHSNEYIQRNVYQFTIKASAHPCLLQQSYGNSQDAPLLMNGSRKCDIYISGILFSHKEE
jgi:hypothetical protein